ncbi:MAG: glycoside hydrolase [Kiritimatiellae bacterium]|nr:glycoside hydrolase [Kiritimatiellia bacterium]
MMKRFYGLVIASTVLMMLGTSAETLSVKMLEGENWWGAANYFGSKMPFTEKSTLNVDLRKRGFANQFASMLISDKGRVVWCEDQTAITITNGTIKMVCGTTAPVLLEKGGNNLKDAFLHAANKWFPSTGRTPDLLFFSAPQYNTWIELTYNQNEKDILAYAQSMLDNGLPPGVLMIDDTWQAGYGDWRFEPTRFKDPKGMMDKLHAQGFKVILWMCPWVSMDIPAFRRIAWGTNPNDVKGYPTKGGFLMDGTKPAATRWWNGYSALLDLTHPNAQAWFKEQLDGLVRDFGADGFKFDGGAVDSYAQGFGTYDKTASSGDQVLAYAKYCLEYPVCEYRNAWRFQGQPVVERLHDKGHEWSELQKLVPDMIGGGLLGHPFMCPDMIGGGSWTAFLPGAPFDAELFVRSAQVHALCPMMQFSASPWRVLNKEHQQIIRDTVAIRQKFAARFVDLARASGHTGEPMLRNLEYNYPGMGYAAVRDQFMMGTDLLVAPVVEKGQTERKVVIPPGTWIADDGETVVGPKTVTVKAPLSRLPYFTLKR